MIHFVHGFFKWFINYFFLSDYFYTIHSFYVFQMINFLKKNKKQ